MKKILFVDKSFAIGGIQTSMINMINTLANRYEIYLFLYNPKGVLENRLNPNVKVIKPNWCIQACGMSFYECMKKGNLKQKIFRFFMTIWAKIFNNEVPLKIALKMQKNLGYFDIAIAYHHETKKNSLTSGFNRFLLECVTANQKISWIHNDSVKNPLSENFNAKYYKKMDKIVCVSEAVRQSFLQQHNNIDKNKVFVCYNFLDFEQIDKKSNEKPKIEFEKHKLVCFSACRLEKVKGIPRAIKALSDIMLKNDIVWYIAGDGTEKKEIEQTIEKYNLKNNVILIGRQENPYCYIKQADILILCSYYEAAPMLYTEAKYFKKPVFTTDISSSREILDNGKYGIICENNEQGITDAFNNIILNENILNNINNNLDLIEFNKDIFIEQFLNIINSKC